MKIDTFNQVTQAQPFAPADQVVQNAEVAVEEQEGDMFVFEAV